ncbi:type IV pilus biogenesis/stability protein PilW [Lampropedia cohaerens]|uniref:type IV pilus biogenesis/stability protein PilW n=1 Tax=Lampropedia cohaerens TaxID=1610491 RepID=UPI000699BA81|nr:type IV pilus biogenesis/stability protein PilW [Lampropedia cohaerens]
MTVYFSTGGQRGKQRRSGAPGHWVAVMFAVLVAACQTSNVTTPLHVATPGAAAGASEPDVEKAVQVRMELAAEYLRVGRHDVAMEEVGRVLALDPGLIDAYMLRGLIHAEQRNFEAADRDFARVLRSRGDDPGVLHNYGWVLCQQGRYDEGLGYLSRVLAMPGFTTSARSMVAKGLCEQRAGRLQQAMATLEQASYIDPNNPIISFNLAKLWYDDGQVARAQNLLRPLNASELANAETLWLGIKVEKALGQTARMRELGAILAQRFPQSRELALYERGAFYE